MKSLQKKLIIFPLITILLGILIIFTLFSPIATKKSDISTVSPTSIQAAKNVSYSGREGVDALNLLKEKATVEQEASGFVSGINGRKADTAEKEFWAFYVNGKMAEVGPADYVTKDTDNIEWKIENY